MSQFQYPEAASKRTTDMSVIYAAPFATTESIFVIEAKRLPAPETGRQKEYVQGNLGAMERFKGSHYGRHLQYSAILGYIEKEDFNFWHKEICQWIKVLISSNADFTISWDKNDLLSFVNGVANMNLFHSNSARSGSTAIHLSHYWLYLN